MHDIDMESLIRLAEAAWMLLAGVLGVIVALLVLLLPVFAWRIVHWTRRSAEELAGLNTHMDQLMTLLISRRQEEGGEGEFRFGPSPLPAAEERPETQGELPTFDPDQGQETRRVVP